MTENAGKMFGEIPPGIEIQTEYVENIYCEKLSTIGAPLDKIIMYFHGGMYVIGSPKGHRRHVGKFVSGTGLNAFVFDYGLAPERPFPEGLNDALKIYEYLLNKGYQPKNIVFAGDSAGAGLCLATLLAIKDKGLPQPAAAAVLSPWTDLLLKGNSYVTNKYKCLSPLGSAEDCSKLYSAGTDPGNYLISPLYGDLQGLAPLHISVGEDEILLDDSVSFYNKAIKSGVEARLLVGEGMCHCYPAFGNLFPEAESAHKEICTFLKEHCGKN
jgi:acetyl esterase/lipase